MIRKFIIIVIIAAVLAVSAAIFFFFFKKGDDGILYKIPNQATSVLIVDVPNLGKKLFINDLGKENKSSAELAKSIPDSLAGINWNNSGLNFLDKLVLFTIEDTISNTVHIHFILPISDVKLFKIFINELAGKFKSVIEKKEDIHVAYYKPLGILLAWNSNYISGMKTSENNATNTYILKKILSTNKEQSIMSDFSFAENQSKDYDALFYSKPYHNNPFKNLEILNSNIDCLTSIIHFNNGVLEIKTELKTKKESLLDKIFISNNNEFISLANTDSSLINILMKVEPNAFTQIYNQYKGINFTESSFPYLKAWNGKLSFTMNGIRTIENEFITYEFDDNFNKIETKKIKKDNIWDIQAIAGIDEIKFDSLLKLNPLTKIGKDTLLFKGANYVFKKTGSCFLTYNQKLERPTCKNLTSNNNIFIEVDYQKLIPLLGEFGIKMENKWLKNIPLSKFSLTLNNSEKTILTSNFYFKDKNKNSLFAIAEGFVEK